MLDALHGAEQVAQLDRWHVGETGVPGAGDHQHVAREEGLDVHKSEGVVGGEENLYVRGG